MLLILINHKYENEMQTISQLFFPGEKFAFVYDFMTEEMPDGYVIYSEVSELCICFKLYKDKVLIGESNNNPYSYKSMHNPLSQPSYFSIRRAFALDLFILLKKHIGAFTPWGSLTGIRPSKLVREWLTVGFDDEVITKTLKDIYLCDENKAKLAVKVAHAENKLKPMVLMDNNAIGVYVSIPFCPSRCFYCSFNTAHKPPSETLMISYTNAVLGEILEKAALAKDLNSPVSSIYIGGGTPTFLNEILLERILSAVVEAFYKTGLEFTVEAGRPETLSNKKLKLLKKYGVNRIAVNAQTLNNKTLNEIGRAHTAEDFINAYKSAREVGFSTINTDLIAGLPGETANDMEKNMETLSELKPENITIHTLAIKRASILNVKGNLQIGNSSFAKITEDMLSIASKTCSSLGLIPYYLYRQKNMIGMFENIGYSKAGHECLYNVGMMAEIQTILGIGAGAVTKYVNDDKISRDFNVKNPEIYINRRITI